VPSLLLWLAGAAACQGPPPTEAVPRTEPATHLTSALLSPFDVALEWSDGGRADVAGRIVEFATESDGEYTIIQFLPPRQTRFTHPDLVPETTFHYRVRAYHGPASSPVAVTMPDDPAAGTEPDDPTWAAPRVVPQREDVIRLSLRGARGAGAAPADLRARLRSSSGILFTWTDHASDEDGFLLEARPEGSADFAVVAVMDPDVNSFGLLTLPSEKRAAYRVRAFYYGTPSNLVRQTTGPDR
jgi:hypothetical protein